MIALLLALAAATPDPLPPAKLVVLEVVDDGAGAEFAGQLTARTIRDLGKDARLDVVGPVAPPARPCEDPCRATIAKDNGARVVLAMTARKRASAWVVDVAVFDADAGRTVDQKTIEAASVAELVGPLRAATDRMLTATLTPPTFPRMGFIAGGVLVGLGVVGTSVGVAGFLLNGNRAEVADNDAERAGYQSLQERFGVVTVAGGIALVAGATLMMVDTLAEANTAP